MMKTYKPYTFFFMFLISVSLFAQQEEKWILAAEEFTLEKQDQHNEVLLSAAKLIPQLILAHCAEYGVRNVNTEESASRTLYALQKTRNGLFSELNKQIQTRDSVLFKPSTQSIKKRITTEEKKITEIEKKIASNINETKKIIDESFEKTHTLPLFLYKDDFTALYTPKETESNAYEQGISGLITGTLSLRGSYLSVTAELVLYPTIKTLITVSDITSISDVDFLAKSIANQLFPAIINALPVQLHVVITPKEAAEKAVLHIDGKTYSAANVVSISSGNHLLYVTSEGFDTAQIMYDFGTVKEYTVQVELKPEKISYVTFTSTKNEGDLYIQAEPKGKTPEHVTLTSQNVLGEFVDEKGRSTFFQTIVPNDSNSFTAQIVPNTTDITLSIKKARSRMYTTYGVLLVSLPVSFISYGYNVNAQNAVRLGHGNIAESNTWSTVSNISTGVSIGCGVLFLVFLGNYLWQANKVIPEKVKVLPPQKNTVQILPDRIKIDL